MCTDKSSLDRSWKPGPSQVTVRVRAFNFRIKTVLWGADKEVEPDIDRSGWLLSERGHGGVFS